MLFNRAYSSAVCAPTRTLMTANIPATDCAARTEQTASRKAPDERAPRCSKPVGYATGGFGWPRQRGHHRRAGQQGFDLWYGYYDQVHAQLLPDPPRASVEEKLPGKPPARNPPRAPARIPVDLILSETLKFIEASNARFLLRGVDVPHGDYECPPSRPNSRPNRGQNIKTRHDDPAPIPTWAG